MSKDSDPVSLVVGRAPRRSGASENDASWSIPGIISCSLAVLLGVGGTLVASSGSKGTTLFWTTVVFGIGAGAGLGLAGLIRSRSSKLAPAIGLLLNLALFAMVVWLMVGPTKSRGPATVPVDSTSAPR